MKRILLIGNGKWGQKIHSTIDQFFPQIKLAVANRENWQQLIDQKPDAVILATPPQPRIAIMFHALTNSIPVMAEKPLSLSYQECQQLTQFDKKIPILINHIHLFAPAYEQLKQDIQNEDIISIKSINTNISPARDYSIWFDFMPHELAMALHLRKNSIHLEELFQINESYDILIKYQHIRHKITISNNSSRQRFFQVQDIDGNQYIYQENTGQYYSINGKSQSIAKYSPLQNAINCFVKSLDGYWDDRFGLTLGLQITAFLEENQP